MNNEEFTAIFKANQALVADVVRKNIYDLSLHEDVMQEVWLRVWASRATYDPTKSAMTTWLTTVAESVVTYYLRDNVERQPEHVLDSTLTPDLGEDEQAGGSWIEETVESHYDTHEAAESLDQLVFAGGKLSEQEAAVFNLAYWHGHSYDYIAKRFGIEVSTVANITARIRAKIEGGMKPTNEVYRYHHPGTVWSDWAWKPEGLGNLRM